MIKIRTFLPVLLALLGYSFAASAADWICFKAKGLGDNGPYGYTQPVAISDGSGGSIGYYYVAPLGERVDDFLHGFSGDKICLKGSWNNMRGANAEFLAYDARNAEAGDVLGQILGEKPKK
jgi:hypothetical protein